MLLPTCCLGFSSVHSVLLSEPHCLFRQSPPLQYNPGVNTTSQNLQGNNLDWLPKTKQKRAKPFFLFFQRKKLSRIKWKSTVTATLFAKSNGHIYRKQTETKPHNVKSGPTLPYICPSTRCPCPPLAKVTHWHKAVSQLALQASDHYSRSQLILQWIRISMAGTVLEYLYRGIPDQVEPTCPL